MPARLLRGLHRAEDLLLASLLGALLMLERQTAQADAAASGLLVLGIASFSNAVAFAAGVVVELLVRDVPQGVTRADLHDPGRLRGPTLAGGDRARRDDQADGEHREQGHQDHDQASAPEADTACWTASWRDASDRASISSTPSFGEVR